MKKPKPLTWTRTSPPAGTDGDCIICTSHRPSGNGYPHVERTVDRANRGRRVYRLSRIICERVHGLPTGMLALHHCGNRMCINPGHIYPGTHKKNVAAAKRHGTFKGGPSRPGASNPSAKLTAEQVEYIRSSRESARQLALQLGVTKCTIERIKYNHAWKP